MAIVSHSEVESRLLCERRHYYAHGEKLQKKTMSEALQRGLDGHEFQEFFFKALLRLGNWDKAMQLLQAEIANKIMLADPDEMKTQIRIASLVVTFLNHYRSTIEPLEIHSVEHEYQVEAVDGLKLGFRPDVVFKVNGYYEPWDWKFMYDFYSPVVQNILPQIPKYMWAFRQMGFPVKQGRYGFIRYRALKNNTPNMLYKLNEVPFNPTRDARTFHEWVNEGLDILELKTYDLFRWERETARVGNSLVCKSCSFKELCDVDLNSGVNSPNAQIMRREMYEPNTYGYTERTD